MGLIAIEMTFGKHIKSSVETTLWESVYFTNILSVIPMFFWATAMQEYKTELPKGYSIGYALIFLLVSSIVGVGIGKFFFFFLMAQIFFDENNLPFPPYRTEFLINIDTGLSN